MNTLRLFRSAGPLRRRASLMFLDLRRRPHASARVCGAVFYCAGPILLEDIAAPGAHDSSIRKSENYN